MDKKQGLAIALIILVGFALGAVILREEAASPAGEQDEPEHTEHADGVLVLNAAQIAAAGIELVTAGAASMSNSVVFSGEIGFDENRTAHVLPQVSGVVQAVPVELGQSVKKGQVLAVLASQETSEQRSEVAAAQRRLELARSTFERERQLWQEKISAQQDYLQARQAYQEADIALQNARQKVRAFGDGAVAGGNRYELRAPFDGVVVARHLALGENVNGLSTGAQSSAVSNEATSAFTLSDLSRVWANFNISPRDLKRVQVGKSARVVAPDLSMEVAGAVAYVGNLLGAQTRTATARVTLENPQGIWRPGLFVSVVVAAETHTAAVTVPIAAVQTVNEQPNVFVRVEQGFLARPVQLGERDDERVEILQGVSAGEQVAAAGSFILKSELGKESAEHSH